MRIGRHKTRAVFDRYNIVSDSDLRAAALKLELSYRQAKVEPEAGQAETPEVEQHARIQ
jgi:hypothetical protein